MIFKRPRNFSKEFINQACDEYVNILNKIQRDLHNKLYQEGTLLLALCNYAEPYGVNSKYFPYRKVFNDISDINKIYDCNWYEINEDDIKSIEEIKQYLLLDIDKKYHAFEDLTYMQPVSYDNDLSFEESEDELPFEFSSDNAISLAELQYRKTFCELLDKVVKNGPMTKKGACEWLNSCYTMYNESFRKAIKNSGILEYCAMIDDKTSHVKPEQGSVYREKVDAMNASFKKMQMNIQEGVYSHKMFAKSR